MARIVLLGGPGAGKGVQAGRLQRLLSVPHISTGEIVRKEIALGTNAGLSAREYVEAGDLVPDEIVVEIVNHRLAEADCKKGFILDGYPRTLHQATDLDALLATLAMPIDVAILLDVSDPELIARVAGRRSCPSCGRGYHLFFDPPKVAGHCDKDGTALTQRDDDKEEAIMARLTVYHQCITPVISLYERRGLLRRIDGAGSPDENEKLVQAALNVP
jgi:adenylate kinase